MEQEYQTTEISESLVEEIKDALRHKQYGSVEIYIEGGRVVQITEKTMKKTLNNDRQPRNNYQTWGRVKR